VQTEGIQSTMNKSTISQQDGAITMFDTKINGMNLLPEQIIDFL